MSYKSELQANNLDLQAILDTVNNLPEAGEGSGPAVSIDSEIPAGYARVGFIKFTGAQVINTGIIGNQDTKIRILFSRDSSDAMYLYGVTSSGNTASITAYMTTTGAWRFGSKSMNRTITADADIIHLAIVQKTGIKSAGGTSSYSGVTDFETPGSIALGGVRQTDGSFDPQLIGKVLIFEMWSGAEQVRRLIPVVSAESVYRFWDTVSETFFDSLTSTPLDGGNL